MYYNKKITGEYKTELSAKCHNGVFVGTEENSILCFRGIPFAVPPVGELRWKEPVEAEESDEVFTADHFERTSMQPGFMGAPYDPAVVSEDCLSLNIWCSKEREEKKAVMVWIHGGAFFMGAGSSPTYYGQRFVETHPDIVLVTINYRLGYLGFADLSKIPGAEKGYENAPVLGLLDQIMALKWVKRNIASFGGDPDNVTIFGESAGATSVSMLTIMPAAEGLFRRAICESGAVGLSAYKDYESETTKNFLAEHGANTLEECLALPEETFSVLSVLAPTLGVPALPYNSMQEMYDAFKSGFAGSVDMLCGTNANEMNLFVINYMGNADAFEADEGKLHERRRAMVPEETQKAIDTFTNLENRKRPLDGYLDFAAWTLFHGPCYVQAEAHSEGSGKNYVYRMTTTADIPCSLEGGVGACHSVDLKYVFGNPDEMTGPTNKYTEGFIAEIQDIWANFAKTGYPYAEKDRWPEYDRESHAMMFLDDGRLGGTHVEKNVDDDRLELARPILKYTYAQIGI